MVQYLKGLGLGALCGLCMFCFWFSGYVAGGREAAAHCHVASSDTQPSAA